MNVCGQTRPNLQEDWGAHQFHPSVRLSIASFLGLSFLPQPAKAGVRRPRSARGFFPLSLHVVLEVGGRGGRGGEMSLDRCSIAI